MRIEQRLSEVETDVRTVSDASVVSQRDVEHLQASVSDLQQDLRRMVPVDEYRSFIARTTEMLQGISESVGFLKGRLKDPRSLR